MGYLRSALRRVLPGSVAVIIRKVRAYGLSLRFADPGRAERARGQISPEWRERIDEVIACPDNAHIPRVPNAGELEGGLITMHNGIQVSALGYCGAGMMNLLIENRGVHEPQEERVFAEIVKRLPPESTMIEVGAYWSFYSLWFAQVVTRPRCLLVEPSYTALRSGRINFRRAGRRAVFLQAYAGAADGNAEDGLPVVTVDSVSRDHGMDPLTLLHADVDGAEVEMLRGARSLLERQRIDYLFISTHGSLLHRACLDLLLAHRYLIMASIDGADTYSVDGFIAAHSRAVDAPGILLSRRTTRA